MSTYTHRDSHGAPNIDDVTRHAKVSRQTFYLYFTSLEDAVNQLGQDFADEMLHNLDSFVSHNPDPLLRLASGIQIFLFRSLIDSLWGGYVSRTHYIAKDAYLIKVVRRDLTKAKDSNLIQYDDLDAASDFFIGAIIQAIRRLVKNDQRSRAYVEHLAVLILLGLRVPYEQSKQYVHSGESYIRQLAPERLSWWRDPWSFK